MHASLILIRDSIKNIHRQRRRVIAEALESRVPAKHIPFSTAVPRSDTNHNPNDIIPDSAVRVFAKGFVELADGIGEAVDCERTLELLFDVPACYGFKGWDFKGFRYQNELNRIGYIGARSVVSVEMRDCGIDGLLFDGDSRDDELGCFDYAAPGMLWAVSEVLS